MSSYVKGIVLSFILFVVFATVYILLGMNGFVIDDGVFYISSVLLGFIQWIYAYPLYLYLLRKNKNVERSKGFLTASYTITLLNLALIGLILLYPSIFF